MSHFLTGKGAIQLSLYGAAHAVVDAISAGLLFSLWQREIVSVAEAGALFLLYNLLAVGAQPILGLVVDWSRQPRVAAVAGCLVMALATVIADCWPLLTVCLAGVGNAIFHLGAGSICLNLTPGRATAPGIFVAPGALGLFVGTYLARTGDFVAWPFVLALTVLSAVAAALPLPPSARTTAEREAVPLPVLLPLVLLLACVGVRSLVGFGVELPWKSEFTLAVWLVALVVAGKALGGVLADRFGWGRVAVGALAVATPMLAFGAATAGPAMAGMFLLNLSMPVTLAATANLLPGRPAFAFGLTCLALELGAWPVMQVTGDTSIFGLPWIVFAATSAAAAALYLGLKLAFQRCPTRFAAVHE